MKEEDLFAFYKKVFQPIYSDLVTYERYIPEQILVEIFNIFEHLANAYIFPEKKDDQILKAYSHLVRITADSCKMLLLSLLDKFELVIGSRQIKKYGLKIPEIDLINMYVKNLELARQTRIDEVADLHSSEDIIDSYMKAISIISQALNSIDADILEKIEKEKKYQFTTKKLGTLIATIIGGAAIGNIVDPGLYGALIGINIGAVVGLFAWISYNG